MSEKIVEIEPLKRTLDLQKYKVYKDEKIIVTQSSACDTSWEYDSKRKLYYTPPSTINIKSDRTKNTAHFSYQTIQQRSPLNPHPKYFIYTGLDLQWDWILVILNSPIYSTLSKRDFTNIKQYQKTAQPH